jgi:hypothetical protein
VTRRFVPLAAMALLVMVALPANAQQPDAQPPMSGQDQSRQAGPMSSPGMGPGMMGGGQMDPKTMARMLQLRGEMLKVMGDSLVQRGKAMETGK